MRKILIFITLSMWISGSICAQALGENGYDLKGIQYAFDRASTPDLAPQTLFVVFYGAGKSGWNSVAKQDYPSEPRRIFSRIYRLTNFPRGYDWNSPSLAPYQMQPLFFDYLIKEYRFTKDNHSVGYLKSPSLSKLEKDLDEMIRYMRTGEKVVPDTKFTFSYRDANYSDPFVFEYKPPVE